MNRDEADRALAALRAARDRVATSMYAIDSHSGLAFLRSGGLTGRTGDIWTALEPEIDARWSEFAAVDDALEEATAVRAGYRPSGPGWSALERAVGGDIPRLLAPLDAGCGTILAILGDVDASWTAAGAAIAPLTEAMSALAALATDMDDASGVAPLNGRVTMLREQVLADPIGLAPGGRLTKAIFAELTALTAEIRAASGRLRDRATVRDTYPRRIAALAAEIDAVEAAEQLARNAYARAIEKIASPGLPTAPQSGAVLRARVSELDAMRARSDWRRLADTVSTVEASITRARARATELASAADGLVDRRNELRGRLEAYRAKAAGNRLEEHEALSKLHGAAHILLYLAPCDLHAATKAVVAYQRALADLLPASTPAPAGGPATAQEDATR